MARPLVLLAAAAALLLREGGCAPIARRRQLQSGGQPEPVPPPFNDTVIAAFRAKELLNPPDVPTENPYDFPPPPPPPGWEAAVCGVLYEDDQARQRYRLETFASREAACEAGAHVTHLTPCDLCSSLEDLAAYMSHWDMTAPGRACGLQGAISRELGLQCFAELGLTPPCAAIWLDNADHTRAVCLLPCLIHLNSPYNREDGSLNDCLQCDEDESGPIFMQVARRTRRNSGMGSAIWRPPDTIANVTHDYY